MNYYSNEVLDRDKIDNDYLEPRYSLFYYHYTAGYPLDCALDAAATAAAA